MSMSRMPYQCLQRCGEFLIAARGSSIDSFSLEDHTLLSTWPKASHSAENSKKKAKASYEESVDIVLGSTEPPAKRRKLTIAEETPKRDGQNGKKKQNNRSDAVSSGLQAPAIVTLAATGNGKHVIAVTGEDKSIRVFANVHDADGKHTLQQISQR